MQLPHPTRNAEQADDCDSARFQNGVSHFLLTFMSRQL
jgi:hypothetical protein